MNNFAEMLRQLGPKRLALMGGVLVGLLLFFVFVSMRISTPNMKLLYDGLSMTDSSAMTVRLEEAKIAYKVSDDGSSIQVAEDQVGTARMLLAQEGLPNGGSMGYELFDQQSGFGTTNFVQNINQVRALEGELSRTISALEQVRTARVHLVLPQRELFSRESQPASASVFLGLRPGAKLDREQILSIQSLVSSAIPQLKAETVSIVDSNGNLLARGGEEDDIAMTVKAEEMRRNYEQRMTQSVEDIIGRVVGYGHVRANVTADLNFDRVSTNEEIYDPQSAVVRSAQTMEESNSETEPPATDISVQNNLPGLAAGATPQPTAQGSKIEETTNFEISKTIRNRISEAGGVKKLSVAVLVDGTYTTDDEGKKTYQPRGQEELDRISALVKSAVGFDEKRGDTVEVVNMQFADIDAQQMAGADNTLIFGFERGDLLDAVEVITVAIMVILVILLVLQPMVTRLMASEGRLEEGLETELLGARPANPALTGPGMASMGQAGAEQFQGPPNAEEESLIDMSRVEGKVKASSVKKVEDIVSSYPSETVSVIRSWMSQEG